MKAIVWTRYGPPEGLELQEVEKPTPKDNQVLIKIHATTVTAGDCEVRSLTLAKLYRLPVRLYAGWSKPQRIKILGQELAGQVEAIGKDVTLFKPGDKVFATTGFSFGAYAEYICLSQETDMGVLAIKPNNMTYAQAAAVPTAGLEALHFMRQANIRNGEKVLIVGAGGSIGSYAVQLAKTFGAIVTGVDRAEKLEMVRSLGADRVIDYTQQDYPAAGETYDVIFDVPGKSDFSACMRALNPTGRYLLGNAGLSQMVRALLSRGQHGKQVVIGAAVQKNQDLILLREMIEAGKLQAVIDRVYPLEQTADAHRYVDSGQKKGNVGITVG